MEVILVLIVTILFALGSLIEKLEGLVKQLKQYGSVNLGKGFQAILSFIPAEQKSEVCATNTNFQKNDN